MKYRMAYKCQLCGAVVTSPRVNDVPYNDLPKLCANVVKNQMFMGNQYLYNEPMQVPHKCEDGSCGMAYFAGFRREV